MSESRISYLNRTYKDYEESIIDITQKYYGDIFYNYNDAGIGATSIDSKLQLCIYLVTLSFTCITISSHV